jgi:hypothetical protein
MQLGAMEAAGGADAAVKRAAAAGAPVVVRHYQTFVAEAKRMGLPGWVKAGRTNDLAISGSGGNQWTVLGLVAGLILIGSGAVLLRRRVVA